VCVNDAATGISISSDCDCCDSDRYCDYAFAKERPLANKLKVELDTTMTGSPDRMLCWDGQLDGVELTVMFTADLLGHWPREEWADQLHRLFPDILAATQRCCDDRNYVSVFDGNEDLERLLVILTWRDISH
jgi:hypothetical protein